MKKLNFKIAILLCMMMCFSSIILSQVPYGFTIVQTHYDDITWYEARDQSGWLGAVYNGKPISEYSFFSPGTNSVSYSHGYFFYGHESKYHIYEVYDLRGKEMSFGGFTYVSGWETINGKLFFINHSGIYDENRNKVSDRSDALVKIGDNVYFITKENGKYGFKDLSNDRQLLANKYDEISKLGETEYYRIKENGKYGLYDIVNDKIVLSPLYDYFFELLSGSNGETFIKAGLDYSHKGIYDISGEEILAPEFQDCECLSSNLFKFKMNGYWGVMNRQGKIIIPLSRQYTQIDYSRTLNTFTFVKEGGYKGECNAKGVQTSIVKMQTQKPQQEAKQPTTPKQTTSTPASSGITSSSNTTSSSKKEDGLLYEGDYTEGPWTNPNTGYSQPAPMPNHHIKIYEDHIIIDMVSLPYQGKSINGEKMYVNSWSNITYYVDGFYNIRSTFPYGYSQFSKGNVVFDMNAPVQGGYDNNNNNSYGTTPQKHEHGTREVTIDCPICHTTGNCQSCNGSGVIYFPNKHECGTCKGNKKCWKCNGTGRITKTERY